MPYSRVVSVGLTLWIGLSIQSALADSSQQAVETLSRYRAAMGLSTVKPNAKLTQAATGHSEYLSALTDRAILSKLAPDGVPEMHREDAGYPKFIGISVGDRAKHFGYTFGVGEQVVLNDAGNAGAEAIEQLMATVYHRSALLNPGWTELGTAVDTPNAVLVMGEGAIKGKVAANWMGVYPADQSTTVRVAFKNEIPDPAPDKAGQWLGLPISVHAALGQTLKTERFELRDSLGRKIAARVLDSQSDKRIGKNEAFLLPESPLQYAMQYSAEIDMSVGSHAKSMRWTFQTPPNPFTVLPTATVVELMPDIPKTLELQGLQGNWSWQVNVQALKGVPLEVKELSSAKMQITFPASCGADCKVDVLIKHEGPHPSTERREFVMSKAWLASRPPPPLVFPRQLLDSVQQLRSARPYSALAYSHIGGSWSWNTIMGAQTKTEAEQVALANCNKNPSAANSCKLYPLTTP